jgi:hypothetical protein
MAGTTHRPDGIGIVDAGESELLPGEPGLLTAAPTSGRPA